MSSSADVSMGVDNKDDIIFELQQRLMECEIRERMMQSKLESQALLLEQLQQSALEQEVDKKSRKHLSAEARARFNYYHTHKNDEDVVNELVKIVPEGVSIPWQWKKMVTDKKFIAEKKDTRKRKQTE